MTRRTRSSVPDPLFRTPDPVDVPGAWFDEDAVARVVAFARFCRHIKGRWAGTPIEFGDWQRQHVIDPTFGWKYPDGNRIIRTLWLELPRKQGKSTKATVLGLYLAGPDGEPGAEVYAAANDKDQGRVVFDPASTMVDRSPVLTRHFKTYKSTITYPRTSGFFRVVSAEDRGKHGYNVHGAVIDEVHVHRSRKLIDALETGTGAREQPLVIFITTAGEADDASIYAEKHDYARKVASGLIVDPSFHAVIYAAEPEDDWRDEAVWHKAQPNLGVTVSEEFMRSKAVGSEASPAALKTFKRFYLNIRTDTTDAPIALERWDESVGAVDEADLKGERCFGGLDVTRSQDVAAFVLDFPTVVADADEERPHRVLWRFWLPEGLLGELDEQTGGMASRWVAEHKLVLTPGDAVDYNAIRRQVLADRDVFDLAEIAFNRRGARQLAGDLEAEDLDLVEMTSGITLAPAMQELERLVLAGAYHHGDHPVARRMFADLAVKQDTEGNKWPDKGKSRGNVSGCLAAVMALDRAVRHLQTGASDLSGAIW